MHIEENGEIHSHLHNFLEDLGGVLLKACNVPKSVYAQINDALNKKGTELEHGSMSTKINSRTKKAIIVPS